MFPSSSALRITGEYGGYGSGWDKLIDCGDSGSVCVGWIIANEDGDTDGLGDNELDEAILVLHTDGMGVVVSLM